MNNLEKIRKIVENECKTSSDKIFFNHHITQVVNYAKELAKKLNADEEIVEIAAWLHDITNMRKVTEDHHITGAAEAEKILRDLKYPEDKIGKIKHCILAHRASQTIKRETKEAECVATADAMSHFDLIPDLFYAAYVSKGMELEEGRKWLVEKLERDWKKVMPEAKELIKTKYEAAKLLLK